MIDAQKLDMMNRMRGSMLDPARQELLPDSDWLTMARAHAARNGFAQVAPRLFIYHHRLYDTFVFACWLDEDRRIMRELFAMNGPPGHEKYKGERVDTPTADAILNAMQPAAKHLEHAKKMQVEAEKKEARSRAAEQELRDDYVKHLKKKDPGTAKAIEIGVVPFMPETE